MAQAQLIWGTHRSDRERRINEMLFADWGAALLLVPTRPHARLRAELALLERDTPGAWGAPITTFGDFAERLLRDAGRRIVRLSDIERRLLLRQVLSGLALSAEIRQVIDTEGFLSHLQRIIEQLKQAAVDPEDFRERVARRRLVSPLDAVVAEAYARYQEALIRLGLFDRIGVFWEACEALRHGGLPEKTRAVRTLLLDGFDDFTPSELRLLSALEPHLCRMVFGLCADPDPDRAGLFGVQRRTAQAIQERWDVETVRAETPPPKSCLDIAAERLLSDDAAPEAATPDRDIEVIPCADATAEVETLGRAVKALLIDGVSPDEIAVVYRSLDGVSHAILSVFDEYGIPVRNHHPPTLDQSSVCAFLLDLVEATEDWEHGAVVDVLTSPWFRPEAGAEWAAPDTVPLLARAAGVVSGQAQWEFGTERLADRLADETDTRDPVLQVLRAHDPDIAAAATDLTARVGALRDIRALIERRAPFARHAVAFDRALLAGGAPNAVYGYPVDAVRERERAALDACRCALAEIETWFHGDDEPHELGEFIALLRQAFRGTEYHPPSPSVGVQCFDIEGMRHLRFDYVFLASANEGQMPSPAPANAIYSDEDVEDLARVGVTLETRRLRADRELLWFHHALRAARKKLTVTWLTLTPDGTPLLRSPYLVDLLGLFPPGAIERPAPSETACLTRTGEAASMREARIALLAESPGTLAGFEAELEHARRGARIEAGRYDFGGADAFDGMLGDTEVVEQISERFGPTHTFSPAQLETYLECPFRFFAERILHVEPIDMPTEEFQRHEIGHIVHGALEAFHRKHAGRPVSAIPPDDARETMRAAVVSEFDRRTRSRYAMPKGTLRVECARLLRMLERYLEIERGRDDKDPGWAPRHFELVFPRNPDDEDDVFFFRTATDDIRFRGRIDRVDWRENELRIVDYKTGRTPTPGDVRKGKSLQLVVYAEAAQTYHFPDTACASALFLKVGENKITACPGSRGRYAYTWDEARDAARLSITAAIAGIRAGRFVPVPKDTMCKWCPARRACRNERFRVERLRDALDPTEETDEMD